ncbi:unnamed protein product [Rotaria sp. Silwood1]|nr:unnamed protein product [Rotaria sp. Silwood1]CAF4616695.1 unnamed protein product [Rotaria sp. Silwood1]
MLEEFANAALDFSNKVKSIVIITVDDESNENSCFPKTFALCIDIFKTHDLDALFVLVHAPGQSASNAVELRMASLSHDLMNLILHHDHFESWRRRSKFLKIFPQHFLPPPVLFAQISSGLVITAHDFVSEKYYGSIFQCLQLNRFVCEEIESDSIPFDLFLYNSSTITFKTDM